MKSTGLVIKRCLDIAGVLLALVLLSPLFLIVAIAICLEGKGSLFFVQPRVGLRGRDFLILKFRSMVPHPIDYAHLQEVRPDNENLTPLGRLIRQYGIDELPQLINILRGEMSFVGPRPTIRDQVELHTPLQMKRLDLLPGLTGLAQVSGNTALPWSERIMLDVWYVDHWSLLLDLRILFRTLAVVLRGRVMGRPVSPVRYLPGLCEAGRYFESLSTNASSSRSEPSAS